MGVGKRGERRILFMLLIVRLELGDRIVRDDIPFEGVTVVHLGWS